VADPVPEAAGGARLAPSTIKAAVDAVQTLALDPVGIEVTHLLAPEYAEEERLPEVCLVAEIRGEPSYFDVFGAQDAISARLGVDVRIIPRRAVWDTHRAAFEAALLPL
jgi:hypothetical protein